MKNGKFFTVMSFKRIYVPFSSVEGENVANKEHKAATPELSLRKRSRSCNNVVRKA